MESDILFAFFSSIVFWITLSGILFVSFGINFKKVESKFTNLYFSIKKFQTPIIKIFSSTTKSILLTLYGFNYFKLALSTLIPVVILVLLLNNNLRNTWLNNKEEINSTILTAITNVDSRYANLVNNSQGREKVKYAFKHISDPQFGHIFSHNDKDSKEIRKLWNTFYPNYKSYIDKNNLIKSDFLEASYGYAYSNPFWMLHQKSQIRSNMYLTIFLAIVFDSIVIFLLQLLLVRIKEISPYLIFISILGIGLVLVLSFVHWSSYFNGTSSTTWVFLFLILQFLFATVLLIGLFKYIYKIKRKLLKLILVLTLIVLPIVLKKYIYLVLSFYWEEMVFSLHTAIANITKESLLLTMTTIFPFILVTSIFIAISSLLIFLKFFKTFLIGHVYGIAVLSGGTFFLGFLSAVVTSTTILYTLIKIFIQ